MLAKSLVYIAQASEYRPSEYWRWLGRVSDFRHVAHRRQLIWTTKARLLAAICWVIYVAFIVAIIWLCARGQWWAIVLIVAVPLLQIIALPVILWTGYAMIQRPRERKLVRRARQKIADHPGVKIAIAGSYGKTTMKELLRTVLEEGLHVAATHGNMNTPIGISRFVDKLDGSEDVLLFEFGEEKSGDVAAFCELTSPSIGIMTGISSAHLTTFKTFDAVVDTIFELERFPGVIAVYRNIESEPIKERTHNDDNLGYSRSGCDGWKVAEYSSGIDGMAIVIKKGEETIRAATPLIGEHLVGPLLGCVAIADRLGMQPSEIAAGIAQTKPFEHRMQPRELHGALIIDDTYNGNPAGVRAGLKLLAGSGATRRIYVTPGLVEQGDQTEIVHEAIGRQVADSADVVVLMRNSVTDFIKRGLHEKHFKGALIEIDDPLTFYENLEQFVAAGDVVLMQNDWTDNYA